MRLHGRKNEGFFSNGHALKGTVINLGADSLSEF